MRNYMLLAGLILSASDARAAVGFGPGQTVDPIEFIKEARGLKVLVIPVGDTARTGVPDATVDGASLIRFIKKLGDSTYTGTTGTLMLEGENYLEIQTRVISQQKMQDGNPAVALRLYRRASKISNPAHIETVADELTLVVRGNSLVLKIAGRPDAVVKLDPGSNDSSIVFTYAKQAKRYGPDIHETYTLMLNGDVLTVRRIEGTAYGDKAIEAFTAGR